MSMLGGIDTSKMQGQPEEFDDEEIQQEVWC